MRGQTLNSREKNKQLVKKIKCVRTHRMGQVTQRFHKKRFYYVPIFLLDEVEIGPK